MPARSFTVSEVARIASVTVRTLHHYDEIGLLRPSRRSGAGYRLYGGGDLLRLQRIRLLRELGFPLEAIRRLLDDPAGDLASALREQRALLVERTRRTGAVIRAVDRALGTLNGGDEMDANELFDGFDDFDPSEHEEEVRARWGDTDAYRESARRTKGYGPEDWARIRAESEAVVDRWAGLLDAGRAPESDEAMAAAETHRRHIDRWFYPCEPAMHGRLGEMYLADPRFAATFERRREGLAAYAAASIRANAERG